ncbi:hypothetical protein [Escherichia coli]|uniref:hypothetical protein n=1 Tax=Escherichia coli TaxID=562 RepID=UPI001F2C8FA0|nr:hypothetical protein [Escherichia coli]
MEHLASDVCSQLHSKKRKIVIAEENKMKNPANKSNVKRMTWIVKWMDSKGDTYTEPFFRYTDAVFAKSVRGGKIERGYTSFE